MNKSEYITHDFEDVENPQLRIWLVGMHVPVTIFIKNNLIVYTNIKGIYPFS